MGFEIGNWMHLGEDREGSIADLCKVVNELLGSLKPVSYSVRCSFI